MTGAGDPGDGGDADGRETRESLADRRDIERDVYQPAEDSALLAAAAVEAVEPDDLVLEVGVGSGYVADRIGNGTGARVVGSDVNPHACRQARDRGVEVVRGDLLAPFCDGAFDVVLFNPPYLPDPGENAEAPWDDWMERALSGGVDGRAVVDPFVATVGRVLAPGGRVLLLVSSLTDIGAVAAAADDAGLAARTLREESYPFERLVVLELVPQAE